MIDLKRGNATAKVNERGEIASYRVGEKEYMWKGDPEFWGWHSPILFPYIGKLKDNILRIGGVEYLQPGKHGFARNLTYKPVTQSEDSCVMQISSTPETLKRYPFPFTLQAGFYLTENGFSICYTVINNGETDMPYTIGAHPAFNIPCALNDMDIIIGGTDNAEYYTADNGLVVLSELFGKVSGNVLPFDLSLVERGGAIFTELNEPRSFSVVSRSTGEGFKVEFNDYPACTLWMPYTENSPFICIEPWCGLPDTVDADGNFESKPFLQILPAGARKSYKMDFSVTEKE